MKIGIIAGNRQLPLLLARRIKEKNPDSKIVAICFKGETSASICAYADRVCWIEVGKLKALREILIKEGLSRVMMAGQINPLRIFNQRGWDKELSSLAEGIDDFRPHTVFTEIINHLQEKGITFLKSTQYLEGDLAKEGLMSGRQPDKVPQRDIDFGLSIISKFVELDVGQAVAVKSASVVALESLEGTDNTIKRAYQLAGAGLTILKFCKSNQDLRFDVAVVGIATLKLLKKIKANSLVLEAGKVIILEKAKFLDLAESWNISVLGKTRSV